jgi:quercetin dioxygenase-like cupin family protein
MRYRSKATRRAVKSVISSKTAMVLIAAVLGGGVVAAVALADTWTSTVENDSNAHLRIVYTYANNFDSGWHFHPGVAIVQVTKGSLTVTQASDCKPKTVSAGETSIEVPYVPVRAVGVGETAWTTTFVLANSAPPTTPITTSPCS